MSDTFEKYADMVAKLRRGKAEGYYRPHKPALLLAILSLIESGKAANNQIHYNPELLELFGNYFEVVKSHDDALNSMDPFWRLRTDGFFNHHAKAGQEPAVKVLKSAPSISELNEICDYSELDPALFELLQDKQMLTQLRGIIIDTYFSDKADQINHIAKQESDIGLYEDFLKKSVDNEKVKEPKSNDSLRDAAFTRIVRKAYDYRCAACGLRVILPDGLAIVDAAHIIPLSESKDNDPRNGMALCKNHHWAMDRFLLAPGTDMTWHVSKSLDDRIEGQKSLIDLHGRSVLLPAESKLAPKETSLEWRIHNLRSA